MEKFSEKILLRKNDVEPECREGGSHAKNWGKNVPSWRAVNAKVYSKGELSVFKWQ